MEKINHEIVIGIGLVFNESGEILIDQRAQGSSMAGMWEFPGGKQENRESIEDTIQREIFEELAIEVEVGEHLVSISHSYDDKQLYFVVHFCDWVSGYPQPLASQKFLWVRPEELVNFSFPAANARMIDSLYHYLDHQNISNLKKSKSPEI